jgi:hypothetical protein
MAKTPTITGTEPDQPDELVPDPVVASECGTSLMGIWRWDRDPELEKLGWPPPIRIRNRKYRSRRLLEAFKARLLHNALTQRGLTQRGR